MLPMCLEFSNNYTLIRKFLTNIHCLTRYVDEEDLLRFLSREEVDLLLSNFDGAVETRKIKKKTLKNWLVNFFKRKFPLCY